MKRQIPVAICFFSGFFMMLQYYSPRMAHVSDTLQNWFTVITVFAFILGAASLLMVNGNRILRKQPGWGYNAVLIVSFFATLAVGLADQVANFIHFTLTDTFVDRWFAAHVTGVIGHGTGQGTWFYWLFQYIYTPMQATMYSLLAFFIASAAFRAFKAKTLGSTLLLVTASFVMFFRAPVGELLWNSIGLGHIVNVNAIVDNVIMDTFNTAGQRAILLGASIGLISVSLKIILGIERSYLGGKD